MQFQIQFTYHQQLKIKIMQHLYKKGDIVSFRRNSVIKSLGTPIVYLCPIKEGSTSSPIYVIENENGWLPNFIRKKQFDLEDNKKYLFVSEKELTLIVE